MEEPIVASASGNDNRALKTIVLVFTIFTLFALQTSALGGTPQQNASVRQVPDGEKMKIQGVVTKRGDETFTLRDGAGVDTIVLLTPTTDAKSHKHGVFRGNQTYAVTYILRGLRLEAEGKGNAAGQLVADHIRFDEQDLRTAQQLQTLVHQADENTAQEAANEKRITAAEQNEQKMAGQIAENTALANTAQATADEALKSATTANNRINGLNEYDTVKVITVNFRTGSSLLLQKGKLDMDHAAAWAKTQNTKGWMVSVIGFADSTGQTESNKKLSERRANAVIGYLVSKHNLPLQRLVQPFGFGSEKPTADNTTADGRAKNRRVEIRILVNKGIANIGN